jgi:hypothetical protein
LEITLAFFSCHPSTNIKNNSSHLFTSYLLSSQAETVAVSHSIICTLKIKNTISLHLAMINISHYLMWLMLLH